MKLLRVTMLGVLAPAALAGGILAATTNTTSASHQQAGQAVTHSQTLASGIQLPPLPPLPLPIPLPLPPLPIPEGPPTCC